MEKEKNNYVLGIIGSLIGGMIATIPWILIYIFGNMMFSLLAILIAFGAFQGYKLCKGKIDKKLPAIIVIVSLISVTIATLVIIPLGLLAKEGYQVSLDNLKILYQNANFMSGLWKDYIISILFTILGISGIVSSLRKQIKETGTVQDVKLTVGNQLQQNQEENAAKVKEVFRDFNAMNKQNAVEKAKILAELEKIFPGQANAVFQQFAVQKRIRKSKKKYYYDEISDHSVAHRFFLVLGTMMLWIIPILALLTAICIWGSTSPDKEPKKDPAVEEKEEYIEEISPYLLTAKFNTEIMDSGMEYPASDDYASEEDNIYWYGLFEDIVFYLTPVKYTGNKEADIVNYTGIFYDKDSKYKDLAIEYVRHLIKANNETLTEKDITEIIEGANELGKDNINTTNGTGYFAHGLLVSFWENENNYQYTVERIMK